MKAIAKDAFPIPLAHLTTPNCYVEAAVVLAYQTLP
jgi:hypothetical protein